MKRRSTPATADALEALLRAAARARARAYAPYSRFPVGAAVLAAGRVFVGCNVENAAYPLSVCAERNAVAAAVVGGAHRIDAVAVVGGQGRPAAPCGGCRQVLAELCAPQAPVVYASADGRRLRSTVRFLLPAPFELAHSSTTAPPANSRRFRAAGSTGRRRETADRARGATRGRGSRNTGR